MIDIFTSVLFLALFPLSILVVKNKGTFLFNCFKVLAGKCTWVGYSSNETMHLPVIRKGILPPYFVLKNYQPSELIKQKMDEEYAETYLPGTDIQLIYKNIYYAGNKAQLT